MKNATVIQNGDIELDIVRVKNGDIPPVNYKQAVDWKKDSINWWYKFTGGTDQNGNIEITNPNNGPVRFKILLTKESKKKYDILSGLWKSKKQFKGLSFKNPNPNSLVVINKVEERGDDYYHVVAVNRKGQLILCDPRVRNQWEDPKEDGTK